MSRARTALRSFVGLVALAFAVAEVARADCQSPANEIVRENCLTGSPQAQWHAPANASIRGYSTEVSVNKGEEVHFLVDTPGQSGIHYDLDIYRLGYYQGLGARKVKSFPDRVSVSQPACAELVPTPSLDPTNDPALITNGRVCNWTSPVIWQTSELPDLVSGLFMAKLTRLDTTVSSYVFFVVRDDNRAFEILLQTSDVTWHAYNAGPKFPNATPVPPGCSGSYPASSYLNEGAALYPRNLFLPTDPAVTGVAGRAYKVSQHRPHVFSFGFYCNGSRVDWDSAQNLVFDFEYPLIRFLEKNGYDVGYIAGRDVAKTPTLLLGPPGGPPPHKMFVTSGHDEYWSGEQKTTIEAARDAGVHLASFAGNQGYVKVRWEDDFHSIVCYRDGWDSARPPKLDPLAGVTTALFRDPRFGAPLDPSLDGYRPENATFGQLTSLYAVNAQIAVPDLSLRQWRGVTDPVTVQCNVVVGAQCLLLGPEIDSDADNGFRPRGLFHLSSTTLENQSHANGNFSQFERGQSARVEHHLTLYRAAPPANGEGALVFSTGTMRLQWALAGLAGDAGSLFSHPVLPGLQQLVVNVFADMGVQPGSLQEAGVTTAVKSTDTAAPVATITAPAATTARALETLVVSGTASDTGGSNPSGKVAAVEVSTDGGEKTWHPATGRASWQYSFTPCATSGSLSIAARAIDDSGNVGASSAAQNLTLTPLPSPSSAAYYLRNGTFECGFAPSDSAGVGNEWLSLLPSPPPATPPQFHNAGVIPGITMQRVASMATGVGIRQDLKLQPGMTHRISARVYSEQGQARLAVRLAGQSADIAAATTTSPSPTWETLSLAYVPTQTDHTVAIYGNTLGSGDCFLPSTAATCFKVDDVRVEPSLGLAATGTAVSPTQGQVNAVWTPAPGQPGFHHYDVERSPNGVSFAPIATNVTATTFTDNAVLAATTYWYRVRAFDVGNNLLAVSNVDPATTIAFTDVPLQAGLTVIKAEHVVQLRQAVNAVRASAGLSPVTWTDASLPGIAVKAVHLTELRNALDPALVAVGLAALPYTDPSLTPGVSVIRRAHIEDIRQRVN